MRAVINTTITPSEDDPEKTPVYWRRKDYPDVVYRTEEAKLRAITQRDPDATMSWADRSWLARPRLSYPNAFRLGCGQSPCAAWRRCC